MKVLASILSVLVCQISFALPSSDLWIPSASVMEKSFLRIDLQQEYTLDKNQGETNHWSSLGATLGLMQESNWAAEAGLDIQEPIGEKFLDALQINGKFTYKQSPESRWTGAMGMRNFALSSDGNYQILYGLAEVVTREKEFTRVGIYFGSNKNLVDADGKKSNSGFMFGYYRQVIDDTGRLAVEWVSGKNAFSYLLVGAHLRFAENVNCILGYGVPNESDYKHRLLARVSLFY